MNVKKWLPIAGGIGVLAIILAVVIGVNVLGNKDEATMAEQLADNATNADGEMVNVGDQDVPLEV